MQALPNASGSKTTGLTLLLAVFAAFVALPWSVQAHETPIALLKLTELKVGHFLADWTYSSSTNPVPPTPLFPEHCQYDYPDLHCGEQGLIGQFQLQQLGEQYSAAVVQISRLDGPTQSYTLTGANPGIFLSEDGKIPLSQVMASYIPLGFEHIMLGVDHLLFVLGLLWLVSNPWTLIKTITSFTIAHSITLAAATLSWIGVPEEPVNAAIALSIVFIAVEVIKHQRGEYCLSAQYPWAIAFGFGLLHGFGFSSALTEIGLPQESLPAALLFFNIGVELGQVLFVLLVIALIKCHRILQAGWPPWGKSASIYGMGSIAGFWFISRFMAIVSV